MPGILPMKVIKIGSNAQTRIAQACDRCRSKKIRCDGIRPCCTQCANVGFECKTSDKLSRRAFPRGYTESLEERVRVLESEVRELKDLLDEKDEKIDMLSRIHSHPTQSPRRPSDVSEASKDEPARDEPDATFRVRQSPYLRGGGSEPYFAGASSARNFIDAFSARLKELKRADVSVDELLPGIDRASDCPIWRAPPRLISDQLVNIFFQEWAPLFPVVHRPTFLATYEEYIANPESMTNKTALANLNLVFGIAALSSGSAVEELENFEAQWRVAVDAIINENTLETLQSLVLAQIYCLQRRDFVRLSTYKGLATTLSARLGLHQAQKSFALGPLTSETRKKVFWTLYTIDCFSSVALGLPKHIKDEDVSCEMPQDIDDEYVSENGFQPVLPGEFTKLSSALALFKAASILSRVLEEVFPAKGTYELSLRKLSDLSDELELWDVSLPPHLRLHFAQDKPSTGTITSRSPVLSLAYHYIRAMIQRPAITASLGNKASSAMLVHAGSCKRIVQIIQLLEERGLCFAFCFDKDEVLILAGIGLLFQQLDDLAPKTLKDNQRTISTIVDLLKDAPPAEAFRKLVSTFQPLDTERRSSKQSSKPSMSRSSSDRVTLETQSSTRKQLKAIASRFGATNKTPSLSTSFAPVNRLSLQPTISADRKLSPAERSLSSPTSSPDSRTTSKDKPAPTNLDYLSFGDEPKLVRDTSPVKSEPQPTDWERLLGNIDNGTTNIFDACYGGPPIEALSESAPRSTTAVRDAALVWNAGLLSLHESEKSSPPSKSPAVASLFSFSSDEGLISNDEVSTTDWSSSGSTNDKHDTLNTLLCDFTNDYTFELESDWQETT